MSKPLFILVTVFLIMVIPGRFIPGALLPGDVVYQTHDTPEQPVIVLNRTDLYFAADTRGAVSDAQTFVISNAGGGTLNWVLTDNVNWVSYFPKSGQGTGSITVTTDPTGLAAGSYNAVIAVSDLNASNTPQYVNVYLEVYPSGSSAKPFGKFSTPKDGSIASGSIPVTGWALDDIGIKSVKLYRQEDSDLVYFGDALFVEGARPDVEQAYPTYPSAYKAGWGYMLLTHFFPNGGNGTFTLHAIAEDKEGALVTLGVATITCDNINAVKPFGAIDTPAQGGTASGSVYRNAGWVLTPQPNKIPEDGSTIDVYVDGVLLGNPVYNVYRPDIAQFFPGYANSNGALAYLDFDTTPYANGVHTIQWSARDSAGNAEGIGSRYFTIRNSSGSRTQRASRHGAWSMEKSVPCWEPVGIIKGYREDVQPMEMYPDHNGIINIQIKELERFELHFAHGKQLSGWMLFGNEFRPLPIGSTLDREKGIFCWQAGVGFSGIYEFVFLKMAGSRREETRIRVTILPKY